MRVGVLSDTHDNLPLVEVAARFFREEGIHRVLHLGDVTSRAALAPLQAFDLTLVRGNNDRRLPNLPPVWAGELDGVPVAAVHGDDRPLLARLIASGEHRFVLHGHSHRASDTLVGTTRVVNPGALQRARVKSVVVLEPREGRVTFRQVTPRGVAPWSPSAGP